MNVSGLRESARVPSFALVLFQAAVVGDIKETCILFSCFFLCVCVCVALGSPSSNVSPVPLYHGIPGLCHWKM